MNYLAQLGTSYQKVCRGRQKVPDSALVRPTLERAPVSPCFSSEQFLHLGFRESRCAYPLSAEIPLRSCDSRNRSGRLRSARNHIEPDCLAMSETFAGHIYAL